MACSALARRRRPVDPGRGAGGTGGKGFARGADGALFLALDGAVLAADDFEDQRVRDRSTLLPGAHGVFASAGGGVWAFGGLRTFEIRRSDDGAEWTARPRRQRRLTCGASTPRGTTKATSAGSPAADIAAHLRALCAATTAAGFSAGDAAEIDLPISAVWGASAEDVYIAGTQLHASDVFTFAAVELPAKASWNGVWGGGAAAVYVASAARRGSSRTCTEPLRLLPCTGRKSVGGARRVC